MTIASARSGSGRGPWVRKVAFWADSIAADRTFVAEVAKWLCHPKVSSSTSGFSTATIRRIHHATSWATLSVSCWRRFWRSSREASWGRGAGVANDGAGAAAAPDRTPGGPQRRLQPARRSRCRDRVDEVPRGPEAGGPHQVGGGRPVG